MTPDLRELLPPTPALGPHSELPRPLDGEPPGRGLDELQTALFNALDTGEAMRRADYNAADWAQLGILADAHFAELARRESG